MGTDDAIVQAARVSYGVGTKKPSTDRALIRHLMRERHTSPFEMVEFKFHVKVPMDCWRQWIRHRTASVNEYSTRYSEAKDEMSVAGKWRVQSTTNKQGSEGGNIDWPDSSYRKLDMGMYQGSFTPEEYLSEREKRLQKHVRDVYEERLEFGVAREQARKDLTLSTYTEAYWKIDLHNLLHFLGLRLNPKAQEEIRSFAEAVKELIEPIVPVTMEAFQDYRLNAITLSGPEIDYIRTLVTNSGIVGKAMGNRELNDLAAKLKLLGITP
jgi:thymidylate synthase (FAD)